MGVKILNKYLVAGAALVSIVSSIPFSPATAADACFTVPAPVISLSFGSRYTTESTSRSDIDEESNAAVDEALGPIDRFIQDLSRDANSAAIDQISRAEKSLCVFSAILSWAKADALSDMQTMNASLAVPSRIGGIAVAYGQVRSFVPQMDVDKKIIEDWLQRRANQTKSFFDKQAPKNASRNNLRAWASMAVGEIGILTRDLSLTTWALDSNKTMVAQSDNNGSLPLEMARKKYALHYQLHAVSPLITSTARLCETGYGTNGLDLNKMKKIARFSANAARNPGVVEQIAGVRQTFNKDLKKSSGMLVWLEPYRALTGDEPLSLDMSNIRPLLNSKLGGDLTRIYAERRIRCRVKPNLN